MTGTRFLLWAVLVALLVALPLLVPTYQVSLATQILIFAVLGMSIDILAGYAGRTPLGHGAIFGTATYVAIWFTTTHGGTLWSGLLLGVLAAGIVALIFALLAVRTSGVYFLLLTLALGMIVWGVCLRWTAVTGGENGLRGSLRPTWLAGQTSFYWLVLGVVAVITVALHRILISPFGLSLRGIRESDSRMRSLGYNSTLHLLIAFVISGLVAGMAGGLYAMFNEYVSPSTVALGQSVRGLLIAVVGGVGTMYGGFIGAIIIIVLENLVSAYTDRWQTVMGLMFILIMIFAPEGVIGRGRDLLRKYSISSKGS
jgi:branched-chain amino acid transport system permease protein